MKRHRHGPVLLVRSTLCIPRKTGINATSTKEKDIQTQMTFENLTMQKHSDLQTQIAQEGEGRRRGPFSVPLHHTIV